jgi:hypothetical protein
MSDIRKINIVPRQIIYSKIQEKEREITRLSGVLLQKLYSVKYNRNERHSLGCKLFKLREEVRVLKNDLIKECGKNYRLKKFEIKNNRQTKMGAQQAKQETVNEIVSVNAGVVTGQNNESILGNNSISKLEVFGIAVLAVVSCATIAKIVVIL